MSSEPSGSPNQRARRSPPATSSKANDPTAQSNAIMVCVRARPHVSTMTLIAERAPESPTNCLTIHPDGTQLSMETGVYSSSSGSVGSPAGGSASPPQANTLRSFAFDRVYGPEAAQETVFNDMGRPLLDAALEGYHTCLFAYGQTGSGKSHSMVGPGGGADMERDPGIVPCLLDTLFAEVRARQTAAREESPPVELTTQVSVSYLEVYQERVRCLLTAPAAAAAAVAVGGRQPSSSGTAAPATPRGERMPGSMSSSPVVAPPASGRRGWDATSSSSPRAASVGPSLRVRQHPVTGVYVEGLAEVPVQSAQEALQLLRAGSRARAMASTKMNDVSSRSHAMFSVTVRQQRQARALHTEGGGTSDGDVMVTTERRAQMHLVDLAGSERVKSSGATGVTLREAALINQSLTSLGVVIRLLAEDSGKPAAARRHVPYRDSTLTFLLMESLGGNSRTCMLATVNPSRTAMEETLSTLRFADRVKSIVTRVTVNESVSDRRIRLLEGEVAALRAQLLEMNRGGGKAGESSTPPPGDEGGDAAVKEAVKDEGSEAREQQDARVDKLLSELRRAEDIIRCLTASAASAATSAPLQLTPPPPLAPLTDLSADAPPTPTGSVGIPSPSNRSTASSRDTSAVMGPTPGDPYLLNMDAVGDWLVFPLCTAEFVIGSAASLSSSSSRPPSASLELGREHRDSEEQLAVDEDLRLPERVATSQTVVAISPSQRRSSGDSTTDGFWIPEPYTAGIGPRHCVLCREPNSRQVRLCPQPGWPTYLYRRGNSQLLAQDTFLENGDILSLGVEQLQFKYMDPSVAPLTAHQIKKSWTPHTGKSKASRRDAAVRQAALRCAGANATAAAAGSPLVEEGGTPQGSDALDARPRRLFVDPATPATDLADPEDEEKERGSANGSSRRGMMDDSDEREEVDPITEDTVVQVPTLNFGALLRREERKQQQQQQSRRPPSMPSPQSKGVVKGKAVVAGTTPAVAGYLLDDNDVDAAREAQLPGPPAGRTTTAHPSLTQPHLRIPDAEDGISAVVPPGDADGQELIRLLQPHTVSDIDTATVGNSTDVQLTTKTHCHTLVLLGPAGSGKTSFADALMVEETPWYATLFSPRAQQHPRGGGGGSSGSTNNSVNQTRSGGSETSGPTRGIMERLLPSTGASSTSAPIPVLSKPNIPPSEELLQVRVWELGGSPCYRPLLEHLPTRRCTYILCFPVTERPTLVQLRSLVEAILCGGPRADTSLLLVGTCLDRCPPARRQLTSLLAELEDLEQHIASLVAQLQPSAHLRPRIAGRFLVDSQSRVVWSPGGFHRVNSFPQLREWLCDHALRACTNDLDFPHGRVPLSCVALATQLRQLRDSGCWTVTVSTFKDAAVAMGVDRAEWLPAALLLESWGVLRWRPAHPQMKRLVVLDVQWYHQVLNDTMTAVLGSTSPSKSTNPLDVHRAVGCGVIPTPALATLLWRPLGLPSSIAPLPFHAKRLWRLARQLCGLMELLESNDVLFPGSRLCLSPSSNGGSSNSGVVHTAAATDAVAAHKAQREAYVVLPAALHAPIAPAVALHLPRILQGPFHRFRFSMAPPYFFAQLLCRVAALSSIRAVYLGPACGTRVPGVDPFLPLSPGVYTVSYRTPEEVPLRASSDIEVVLPVGHEKQPLALWRDAAWLQARHSSARALLRMVGHSLFIDFHGCQAPSWGGSSVDSYSDIGIEEGDVHIDESAFLPMELELGEHMRSAAAAAFHAQLMSCVRTQVQLHPGAQCEEALRCHRDYDALERQSARPLMSPNERLAPGEEEVGNDTHGGVGSYYRTVEADLNSLERIHQWEEVALRTARTRRTPEGEAPIAGDWRGEEDVIPFLRRDNTWGVGGEDADVAAGQLMESLSRDGLFFVQAEQEEALQQALVEALTGGDGDDHAAATASGRGLAMDRVVDLLALAQPRPG